MPLTRVASLKTLESGESTIVETAAGEIALVRLGGNVLALSNTCCHRGGPLGDGEVDEKESAITCPWHGWRFDCRTGACLDPGNGESVETFTVEVDGDDILVDIPV